MGMISAAECMALSSSPILFLNKISLFFFWFILNKKGIGRQPSIRISPATGKESIYFILRDKNFMFLPLKPFSCLIGNRFFRKFLKLCGYSVRTVIMETHNFFIHLICFCKSFQTFIKVCKKFRLLQQISDTLNHLWKTAIKYLVILKNKFWYAFRHITLHIRQRLCMFFDCICPGSFQNSLWCIFTLA